MAQRWCYVGALGPGGILDWGQPGGGNIPTSGTLPDFEDFRLYNSISELALAGSYHGGIIDFDAYGLKVNGPELRDIITACYMAHPAMMEQRVTRLYLDYADGLGAENHVALVAVAM